jgi:fructose-specific phosphotransferase system component IIB
MIRLHTKLKLHRATSCLVAVDEQLSHTRYALHKRAYQHRVAAAIELMHTEVLVAAD